MFKSAAVKSFLALLALFFAIIILVAIFYTFTAAAATATGLMTLIP